jgi:hypothetical protein
MDEGPWIDCNILMATVTFIDYYSGSEIFSAWQNVNRHYNNLAIWGNLE